MNLTLDLQLPFKLPIKDGQQIISGYNEEKFKAVFNTNSVPVLIVESGEPPIEKDVTVITLSYFPEAKVIDNLDHDNLLRHTVLSSIDYINSLLDALMTSYRLNYIYNITIADLPLLLLVNIENESFLYTTKPQELLKTNEILSKDEISKVLSTMGTFDRYPEIYLVEKFFASAKSHLYREELVDAIVDLQTSFEIFIRNTHRLILLQDGKEMKTESSSTIPFRNVIEHHLEKYLNVDLKFDTPGVINEWYKNLYCLRNEIVHNGRINVDGNAAYAAYDAYVNARNYISDKLYEKGFLKENKNVDLTLFRKNNIESIDHEEVLKSLKDLGIVDEEVEFKKD